MATRFGAAVAVLGALLLGCADSTGPEPLTTDALIGTWRATSVTYSTLASPVETRERIDPDDIISQVYTIDASGHYARRDSLAWLPSAFIDSGRVEVRGDSLLFASQFGPAYGSAHPSLQGNKLVMADSGFGYLWPTSTEQEPLRYKSVYVRQ
ncbi:MAG TPA: hypothetical protein PKA66_12340 [Gemmatimonadales bacterium]|mgnify:CR=1 FL=1|nr:hypothetical protein [Gemmatimonadales bacterium]